MKQDKLSASEALFAFVAQLTTQKHVTKLGSSENCAPVCDALSEFIDRNNLSDPREGWEDNVVRP